MECRLDFQWLYFHSANSCQQEGFNILYIFRFRDCMQMMNKVSWSQEKKQGCHFIVAGLLLLDDLAWFTANKGLKWVQNKITRRGFCAGIIRNTLFFHTEYHISVSGPFVATREQAYFPVQCTQTLKCTMCASVGITVQLNTVCSRCSMTVLGTLAATELLVNSVTGGRSAAAHAEQLTC